MNFTELSDNWLEDIFIQLDFVRQCQLRRTCRRWHRLLRSAYVLRNLVIILPFLPDDLPSSTRYQGFASAVTPASKYTDTIHLLAPASPPVRYNSTLLRLFVQCLSEPHQRLILENITCASSHITRPGVLRHFREVEFRNVTFVGGLVRWCLYHWVDFDQSICALSAADWVIFQDWSVLQVLISRPFVLYPEISVEEVAQDETRVQAKRLAEMMVSRMLPLSDQQMMEMTGRLMVFPHDQLRSQLSQILTRFTNRTLEESEDLTKLDYTRFEPIVQRLLFCWNGEPSAD